jgi:murein DD-endopeptidase MepM/ murein hydrolase activator NlpD
MALVAADPAPATCGGADEPPVVLRWPARGSVTSGFGSRNGRQHDGIDISGYHGAIVRAAADGTVVFSGRKRTYGRVVILEHGGGLETVYAHNTDNFVVAGSRVRQGQGIADMGSTGRSTGPHLHFEVRLANRPVDPLACLPERSTTRR